LNQVVEINTPLSPEDLLEKILYIELAMGRVRIEKWGPRLIDIDILSYRDKIINTPKLVIPHPEIQNRRFTLEPLCELAPKLKISGKTVEQLLKECKDPLPVTRLPHQP
jgi:2-amino-4-hydroxy-6-hydroxymethyldihydropteridine diphosphokinase